MPKALIITEKPSVARDIVAALGGFTARGSHAYWESDEYLCSFAVGHIFTLLEPEDIDSAYKQWKLSLLPILPKSFQLKPIAGHEPRIALLQKLIERDDVNVLINACDAAREGELIFRELVSFVGSRKWVRRLWLQSMTPEAIRQGFRSLRDGTDLESLGQAAECRARSDWLIGMNATRAFSERLRSRGERTPWSVGRVQTPTLALLVERELVILGHRPRPYYRVVATFDAGTHTYEGTWFNPAFKAKGDDPDSKDDRIFERHQAAALLAALTTDQPVLASETREESLRHAPYLFSLTALQKYMAQRYKWSAKRTLEAAQRCYETHKVLTYPRTSSVCLPDDYRGEVTRLIAGFAAGGDYREAAAYLTEHGRRNDQRTFNNAGVSDHFAIIPTGKQRALSGDDGRLYDAVVRRFLANFYPPSVYDKVKRLTVVGQQHYRTGPLETLVIPGWQSVYERSVGEHAVKALVALRPGQKKASDVPVGAVSGVMKEDVTKPPPRINEAGLLSLMEHAGRQIDDHELQAALTSAEGLGTAATRADIIQNLKLKEYVDEALRPTFKGIHLIRTLDLLQVSRLTSPELTARLELELAEVEAGQRPPSRFMGEVNRYTTEVVEAARRLDWEQLYPNRDGLGPCPLCGDSRMVYERPLLYACETVIGPDTGCGLRLWKDTSGRYLTRSNIAQLLAEGSTHALSGFRTQGGREFNAALTLVDGKLRLIDDDSAGMDGAAVASSAGTTASAASEDAADHGRKAGRATSKPASEDATDRGRKGGGATSKPPAASARKRASAATPRPSRAGSPTGSQAAASPQRDGGAGGSTLGTCPVHGAPCQVVATRGAFVCEHRLKAFAAGDPQPAGVMIPRLLCKRELTAAEVSGMLAAGVTPELGGFVSKAGKEFRARLRLNAAGGFDFEFPPRDPNRFAKDARSETKSDQRGRQFKYPRRRATPRRASVSDEADV